MFHVKHDRFDDIARWLDITLTPDQRALLSKFEQWLAEEAVRAGGVGRKEADRLWDRHIADSLAFIRGIPIDTRTLMDVGGGVGLPSIPIAIVRPELACTLIDRSQRRASLAQRAVRVLAIPNLSVVNLDIDQVHEHFDVATFRASLRMPEAAVVSRRILSGSGVGLFAVSRREQRPSIPTPPDGIDFHLSSEGTGVLDTPFWLLRMQRS